MDSPLLDEVGFKNPGSLVIDRFMRVIFVGLIRK
jgi:hypothetical protein